MENSLATRLARVEATVARLATAVDAMADMLTDARPLVLTKAQLTNAVREAMTTNEPTTTTAEPTTPPPRKRAKKTHGPMVEMDADLPSPSSLTLSMLVDTIASDAAMPSPPPVAPSLVRASVRAAAVVLPARPAPQAPVYRPLPPPPPPVMPPPPFQAPPHIVTPPQAARSASNPESSRRYLWGNAWHHLPEDYEFPKESLEVMWRQWCCGIAERGIRPLREILASDIATTNNRKRLSDLKYLMKFIEQQLQDRGVWKEAPSEVEADQMLRAVQGSLPFTASSSKNGQKRGLEGLKWHSAVTLLRNANKKARGE